MQKVIHLKFKEKKKWNNLNAPTLNKETERELRKYGGNV